MTEYFEVGKILTTHGLKGEVKVNPITDFIDERFAPDSRLFVGEGKEELTIERARMQKQFVLVQFKEITDIDQAQKYLKKDLYVSAEDRSELPEGSYYFEDIIGLPVYDVETGEKLGVVANIETPGANDIFEIKPEHGKVFWIPNVATVVKNIDIDQKRIDIELLEGLRDED